MLDLAANDRPLPLKRRADVIVQPRDTAHGRQWICKDPIRRRYYALSEIEYYLWSLLDGRTTLAEAKAGFARTFPARRLDTDSFVAFLGRLFRQELIVATAAGQGASLAARASARRWQELATMPLQILSWRMRGIDPDRALSRLLPLVQWVFTPLCGALLAILLVVAGLIAFTARTSLQAQSVQLADFFRAENLVLLLLTLSVVKILHELGHAFTCKYLGGEVRELGVMFLFFAPCLYCDVSDAWLFPRRWQRMAVSAAGMVVEICLAALATILWWSTQPGLLHNLALNVMFVCGISTLLINGNPLMRYDAYYLLSDALDLPNLDERARTSLRRVLATLLFGVALPRESPRAERGAGIVFFYGLLSTVYRWLLLAAVLWMLHGVLQPLRLEVVAMLATTLCLAGVVATPVWQASQQLSDPFVQRRLSPQQLLVRGAVVLLLLAAILFTPLPCRVAGPGVIESSRTELLYATTPGRIVTALAPGTEVQAGQQVVTLDNAPLRLKMAELEAEAARLKARLAALEALRGSDPEAASELPTTQEVLRDIEQQVVQHQRDLQRLNLVATQSGRVVESARRQSEHSKEETLATWTSTPLAAFNVGAEIATGTLVAQVVDPQNLEVQLLLDPSQVELVRMDQAVRVSLWQAPGHVIRGTVIEVSRTTVEEVPPILAAAGDILVRQDVPGKALPLDDLFQVRVRLERAPPHAVLGGRCTARVLVDPQSVSARLLRYLRRTFGRS